MIDELKSLLAPMLARRLLAVERRQLAAALHFLAEQQEQIAAADDRIGHSMRRVQEEATPRKRTGRPLGSGGSFVTWAPYADHSGDLSIAPRLWRDLGQPERLDVQRLGHQLELRPCLPPAGWKVLLPSGARGGMPKLGIGRENADILRLAPGRSAARIVGGAIIVE